MKSDAIAAPLVIVYGPTYETRGKRYAMDSEMAKILSDYIIFGRTKASAIRAFFEGIEARRIVEIEEIANV